MSQDQTPSAPEKVSGDEGVNDAEETRDDEQTITITDTERDQTSQASTADEDDRDK